MIRDMVRSVFTTAFIALCWFAYRFVQGWANSGWDDARQGLCDSIIGIIVGLVMIVISGLFLYVIDRKKRQQEKRLHQELLEAINYDRNSLTPPTGL
jgi:hypothetical protein